jgi:hypothetical protein
MNRMELTFVTIKQIDYYVKKKKILYNYWYFVMVTCFGLCLDHMQVSVFCELIA